MYLQKSNLCTAGFPWCRLARSPAASCFVWHRRRSHYLSHGRFVCSSTVPLPCLLLSPTIFLFPLLFSPLVSSADPWGALLSDSGRSQTSAAVDCCGVGVRRILMSGHVGASRTQGSLSPTPPLARSIARSPAFCPFFRAHSHSLPAWSLFPSFFLAFSFLSGRGFPFPLCSVFS